MVDGILRTDELSHSSRCLRASRETHAKEKANQRSPGWLNLSKRMVSARHQYARRPTVKAECNNSVYANLCKRHLSQKGMHGTVRQNEKATQYHNLVHRVYRRERNYQKYSTRSYEDRKHHEVRIKRTLYKLQVQKVQRNVRV